MTAFKVGDIVRLTKGEPHKPGFCEQVKRVGTYTDHLRYESVVAANELPFTRASGWTVELIEQPAAPLPTRPNTLGWATVNGTRRLVRLGVCGQWEVYGKNGALAVKPRPSVVEDFEEAVLIPKELADKVMEWVVDEGGEWHAGGILDQIADHLKRQDNE